VGQAKDFAALDINHLEALKEYFLEILLG